MCMKKHLSLAGLFGRAATSAFCCRRSVLTTSNYKAAILSQTHDLWEHTASSVVITLTVIITIIVIIIIIIIIRII